MKLIELVLTLKTVYDLEEEEEFETDGIPWTEAEIIQYFKERWAERIEESKFSDLTEYMSAEIYEKEIE